MNLFKAVASFFCIVASVSGGVDHAEPEQAERHDSAHRGHFLPLRVYTEAVTRLFISVLLSGLWFSLLLSSTSNRKETGY